MTTNEPPYGDPQRPGQPGDLPSYGSTGGDVPPPPGGYGDGNGGYGGGYGGGAPEQNKKALWSMILGIVGLLCCGVAGVVAIVLSTQAKKEIEASGGRQTGAGMATAGLVIGIVAVVLWILGVVVNFALMD